MDDANLKPGADKPDKDQRLAEALRENLRKRKAQSRARSGGVGIAGEGPDVRAQLDTPANDTRTDNEH